MSYNPNEHDTVIRYSTYDLLLCEIDQDGTTQVHPNGQPRLFSYNSDGLSDVLSREMDYLNDCKSLQEDVNPIPMGEKPIHKTLLKIVEDYISEEIKIAEETGYTDDICEGRREMAVAIQELLANARKEVDSDE